MNIKIRQVREGYPYKNKVFSLEVDDTKIISDSVKIQMKKLDKTGNKEKQVICKFVDASTFISNNH